MNAKKKKCGRKRERERERDDDGNDKKNVIKMMKRKSSFVKTVEREVKDQFFICIASFFCDAAF